MARASKTFQVTIRNNGQTIACAADRTILQAAVAAGVDYPYACATIAIFLKSSREAIAPR